MYYTDTNDWGLVEEMDKRNIVGAVLVDFSSTFYMIDHDLLLKKRVMIVVSEISI
jgi:hypothetical protein